MPTLLKEDSDSPPDGEDEAQQEQINEGHPELVAAAEPVAKPWMKQRSEEVHRESRHVASDDNDRHDRREEEHESKLDLVPAAHMQCTAV